MHVTQLRQLSALSIALLFGLGTAMALAQQAQPQAQPPAQPGQRQVQPGQQPQAQPAQPGQRQGQAQSNQQRARQGGQARGQAGGQGTRVMAHWLLVDNQGEIELAKFAREKSQNEEVKEFATMMIQDHTDIVEGLQQLAGRQNPAAGGQPREGQQRREGQQGQAREGQQGQAREGQQGQDRDAAAAGQAQRQPGQPQAGRPQPGQPQAGQQPGQPAQQAGGGQGFDLVRIKHEIGQQCVASLKEKLSEKKGAEFDKCYMGHQVVAHMQMLDTLKVFQKHADGQLAELINGGIQTTEDHLMHAEEIMKKLEGGAAASTARRPGEQKRD